MTNQSQLRTRRIDAALWPRIEQTVACRDADSIPKVSNAGRVIADEKMGLIQIMHNGVVIREGCYYGDWMTEVIERLRGHHEPQEELAFHAIVSKLAQETESPNMIEIGAFWSYYSLWLLKVCPNARTVLVEPDPNDLRAGRENFLLNGFDGHFVHSAVGPVDLPEAPFHCESDGELRLVKFRSLPTIAAEAGLNKVDILLIDAQGVEAEILESAQDWIRRSVRFLVVSTHHHSISGDPLTHQRCKEMLTKSGAHFIAEHTVAESCSGDGLIAVSFADHDNDLNADITIGRACNSLFGDPLFDLARAQEEKRILETERALLRSELKKRDSEILEINATVTMKFRRAILKRRFGKVAAKAIRAIKSRN